ncbi:LemA family protein, partial [Escherichia sp. SP-MK2]
MLRTFIVIIFIFNLSGCGYNDIQTYDEQVNASWSEVLNQYQRRADLIPNLVASIKGYSNHEKDVLEAVTLARSQANRASSDLQHLQCCPRQRGQTERQSARLSRHFV